MRTVGSVVIASCVGCVSRSSAFLQPPTATRTPCAKLYMTAAGAVSRRGLLKFAAATAIGVAGVGTPQPALAVAFGGPDALRARFGEKLRRASKMLDELQQDIFDEDWDLVVTYPAAFRSLVPIFTKYTDAAFPSDNPIDKNTRVSLRYEVGRFFGAVERLKRAADSRDTREAEAAFAAMSVAYDRYLKAGSLYESYDPITSTEPFFAGIDDKTLRFVPPGREPPQVRDSVMLIGGPDKGKTGKLIGQEVSIMSRTGASVRKAIVKLTTTVGGIREIKVVPYEFVAKTIEQTNAS